MLTVNDEDITCFRFDFGFGFCISATVWFLSGRSMYVAADLCHFMCSLIDPLSDSRNFLLISSRRVRGLKIAVQ